MQCRERIRGTQLKHRLSLNPDQKGRRAWGLLIIEPTSCMPHPRMQNPSRIPVDPSSPLGVSLTGKSFSPLYRSDKEGQENSSFPRLPASLVIGSQYQVFLIAELGPFLVQHTATEVGTWKSTEHPSTRRRDGEGTGC